MSKVNINRPVIALENIFFINLLCYFLCLQKGQKIAVFADQFLKCTDKLAGTQKVNRIMTKFVSTVYVVFILRFNVRCHSNGKQIIIVRLKFVWDYTVDWNHYKNCSLYL